MTIYKYNTNFYPKYSAAYSMLNNIEHALEKCENPEDVKYQFSCIGLNEDTINFLIEAVIYYNLLRRIKWDIDIQYFIKIIQTLRFRQKFQNTLSLLSSI